MIGNGFTRIYRPDGFRAVEDPAKTFEGLVIADIDLDENLLTKRLADFVCQIPLVAQVRMLTHSVDKGRPLYAPGPDSTVGGQDAQDAHCGCQLAGPRDISKHAGATRPRSLFRRRSNVGTSSLSISLFRVDGPTHRVQYPAHAAFALGCAPGAVWPSIAGMFL